MEHKWWTLIAVSVAIFMLLLDITVVNVALPDIQRSLHSSFQDLQWVVDAYSLTLAAFLLTAGALADLLGRKRVFLTGLVIFTGSSVACGLSTSSLMLNLARGVQGTGGAMMFATSLALIAQAYSGRDRGIAFGVFGAVTGAAVAVGPLIGGVITSGIGWEWIFFVNVPIGVGAVYLTLARVEESRDPQASGVDWLGLITFSGSLFLLVFALVRGNDKGWGSPQIVSFLVASVVLLVLFVVVERAQERPMLDLTLFRVPGVHRRRDRRLHALQLDLRNVPVPDPLRPERPRLQPAAGRPALPADHAAVLRRGAVRGQADRARGRAPAARDGLLLVSAGLLAMTAIDAQLGLDHADPRVRARRRRDRSGQPAARGRRDRRRARGPQRYGLGDQQHLPTGRDSHRDRRARRRLPAQRHARRHPPTGPQRPRPRSARGRARTAGSAPGVRRDQTRRRRALPAARAALQGAYRVGFTSALTDILIIGGVVALVGSVCAFVLVRSRDFVTEEPAATSRETEAPGALAA